MTSNFILPNQSLKFNRIDNLLHVNSSYTDSSVQVNLSTTIDLSYHYHVIFSRCYEDIGDIINELSEYDKSFIYVSSKPLSQMDHKCIEDYYDNSDESIEVEAFDSIVDGYLCTSDVLDYYVNTSKYYEGPGLVFLWGLDDIESLRKLSGNISGHSFIISFDESDIDEILHKSNECIDICHWTRI